jgi:hypothetical protein
MLSLARQLVFLTAALAGAAATARAQGNVRRPPAAGAEDSTRVTLSLAVGSQRFDEAKQGRCTHAPQASIFGTLAEMWSVQVSPAAKTSLALTVWRPTRGDSTAQMTLHVSNGSTTQRISTVKGTKTFGDGTVQFTKHGAGGGFEISGSTESGAKVSGRVDCEKFSAPAAVGGN